MDTIRFTRTRNVKAPKKGHSADAGIDFFVPEGFGPNGENFIEVPPHMSILIPSGIKVELPEGMALIAFNKSSVAKQGWIVGACVIDNGYQGEIHLHLMNTTPQVRSIIEGVPVVQFIPMHLPKIELQEITQLELFTKETPRADGGFGSTQN